MVIASGLAEKTPNVLLQNDEGTDIWREWKFVLIPQLYKFLNRPSRSRLGPLLSITAFCIPFQHAVDRSPMSTTYYYELYQQTSIGLALADALNEFIKSGHIDPQLALKILVNVGPHEGGPYFQFDKAISDELTNNVKSRLSLKVLVPFILPISNANCL